MLERLKEYLKENGIWFEELDSKTVRIKRDDYIEADKDYFFYAITNNQGIYTEVRF